MMCHVVVVVVVYAGRRPRCPINCAEQIHHTVKSKKYFKNLLTQLYYDFRYQLSNCIAHLGFPKIYQTLRI